VRNPLRSEDAAFRIVLYVAAVAIMALLVTLLVKAT
jgi:hypothetical protein